MVASAALAALVVQLAVTQAEPSTPPPPPPSSDAAVAPAPEPAASAAPATTGETAAPAATPSTSPGRFRFGATGQIGALLPSPALIAFGVEGRFGWTFTRLVALYLSAGLGSGLGFWGGGNTGLFSVSISTMSQWYVGAMAELNVGDLFFVALGPGIGRMSSAGVTVSAGTSGAGQQIEAMGGWTPSIDLRLGFGFGKPDPVSGRRTGFTLGLDCRAVFPTQSVYVRQDQNGQEVRVNGTGWGFIPMIMLGFDSR